LGAAAHAVRVVTFTATNDANLLLILKIVDSSGLQYCVPVRCLVIHDHISGGKTVSMSEEIAEVLAIECNSLHGFLKHIIVACDPTLNVSRQAPANACRIREGIIGPRSTKSVGIEIRVGKGHLRGVLGSEGTKGASCTGSQSVCDRGQRREHYHVN